MTDDLLDAVLALAWDERAEGALAFGEGLRDRARLILEERLRPVEERAAAFEKECAWRAESMRSLEATLENERALWGEKTSALEGEIDALRTEGVRSAEAHDRLLSHHRVLMEQVVESLSGVAELLPWRPGRAKARLAALAGLLRRELP